MHKTTEIFSDNYEHNSFDFCNILEKFQFAISKEVLDNYHANILNELHHGLSNYLGLKVFKNEEIVKKISRLAGDGAY